MRTLLQLNNLYKSYGAQVIFENASLAIAEDHKIGVIGRNGAGKSTLCKVITGQEELDGGSIQECSNFRLAYLEQHDPFRLDEKVIDFLMRYTGKEAWECGKIAASFQLTNEILEKEIGTLPGGFRTRVKLASMLLRDPNFLILDEPTNYLDLKTLILLEEFLLDFRGGFIIVSHDREFLIKTCKETLEIENGSFNLYPGTVEEYLMFKEEQVRLIDCHNKNILAKKKQLQAFIDRFGAKASKATQSRSMKKKMERLKTIDTEHQLGNVHIKIPNVEKRNIPAFRCEDLAVGYPTHVVADKINMEFNQGEHVAVLGDNGQGKTTFMRTVAGDLDAKNGTFKWGYGLKVGYYAQHVLSSLDPRHDVYDHLLSKSDNYVTKQDILALAGSFLFRDDDVYKKVPVLSGGEKARLCLAGLLLSKSDVLLLDEPTNHLDFETVEALGIALKKFDGTIFFISHDRTFVNMLATQIVEVKDGAIIRYPGNYEEYVYSMETRVINELSEDEEIKPKPKTKPKHNPPTEKKSPQSVEKELKSEISNTNSRLKEVQARLDGNKKELEEIHKLFVENSANWSLERSRRFQELEKLIKEDEDLWLALVEKIDSLNKKISGIRS